jgi:hypothetical protein
VRAGRRSKSQPGASAVALALLLVLCEGRATAAEEPPGLVWRSLTAPVRGGEIAALAWDRASATLALGDLRGVLVGPPDGSFERRLRRGLVRDLAFLRDPTGVSLLAATARGLFLVEPSGGVLEVSPGPGAPARAGNRLALADGWIAVATDDGVFLSRDARHWLRPATAFPAGPASAVALRGAAGGLECWAVIGGEPWSARLIEDGPELTARESLRQTVSFATGNGGPVDVVLGLPGADVALVYPSALALRDAQGAWSVLQLDLPPGAEAQRLAAGAGRLFLASLRGLLVADSLAGPWRRAEPPAGSAAVRALAGDASVLFAAADTGLLAGEPPAPRPASASPAAPALDLSEEPGIERVHQAALAYLRLGPGWMDGLKQGVGRRGWLPIVALHGGLARDTTRTTAWDEAVTGGALWSLVDRDHDRTDDYDVGLTFSWDLGDLSYNPEEIDVSREAREVIELRDDVLDEITQLYFERRRVIAQLQLLPDPGEAEQLRLRLRADELAAGIDAWTGGWFGRLTGRLTAQTPARSPTPSQSHSSPRAGGN